MEKINTEEIISSLFLVGFEKVDSMLFIYTLAKLSIDNRTMHTFEFVDKEFSSLFKEYVLCDGNTYMLKEGYTLDTLVRTGDTSRPLKMLLHTNKRLNLYLNLLDYREIIMKKIADLKDKSIYSIPAHFCNKEKEIIYKMFGIEAMHREKTIERAIAYETIYNEEASELDLINFDNGFLNKIIARNEEIDKISTNQDYINWLSAFVNEHGNFYTNFFEYGIYDLTEEDLHNIEKLNLLYDAIDEYATEKNIDAYYESGDDSYSYFIKYADAYLNIGFSKSPEIIFHCMEIEKNENAIDFNDVIEYNNKRKTKTRTN